MVRELGSRFFKPPWPFVKKTTFGHRKIGPMVFEKRLWPGQNREFPEFSPNLVGRFREGKPPMLNGWHEVQPTGYTDPATGKFVHVPEMVPELVVPDLTGFELRPYVSYRTDVDIQDREKRFAQLVAKKGEKAAESEATESDSWPPPRMEAKTLFELFYAERVRDAFIRREKADGKKSAGGLKMRVPFFSSKRALHTTPSFSRGPLKFPGWYPRDHKPGPPPKNEQERRSSAMKYGLRPEDYKPIDPEDFKRYCGDYPELGVVTWMHRDPYEDYSDRYFRRNWNEPVIKDWLYYRPDRVNFTGLELDNFQGWMAFMIVLQVVIPLSLFLWYLKSANPNSFRWKNPVMPKHYPYDLHRAVPFDDPLLYPITNYSFEPEED